MSGRPQVKHNFWVRFRRIFNAFRVGKILVFASFKSYDYLYLRSRERSSNRVMRKNLKIKRDLTETWSLIEWNVIPQCLVTDRTPIKLQLTGKSRFIFKFYSVTALRSYMRLQSTLHTFEKFHTESMHIL